jgi:hypothetical protein
MTPLSRALYWKREARIQSDILDGLGRDPGYGRDVADDAYREAMRNWRSIIRAAWIARAVERYAPVMSIPVLPVEQDQQSSEAA